MDTEYKTFKRLVKPSFDTVHLGLLEWMDVTTNLKGRLSNREAKAKMKEYLYKRHWTYDEYRKEYRRRSDF